MIWRTVSLCARTYTQSASCSFKLRSLTQSDREGKREQEEECEHCGVLGDSENTQFRLRPDSRCRSPMSFWTLTSIWRGSRRTETLAHARIAESGTCRGDSMPAHQLETLRCIWLRCLLYVYCDLRRCWKKNRRLRNARRRSHGTRSYLYKQDVVVSRHRF